MTEKPNHCYVNKISNELKRHDMLRTNRMKRAEEDKMKTGRLDPYDRNNPTLLPFKNKYTEELGPRKLLKTSVPDQYERNRKMDIRILTGTDKLPLRPLDRVSLFKDTDYIRRRAHTENDIPVLKLPIEDTTKNKQDKNIIKQDKNNTKQDKNTNENHSREDRVGRDPQKQALVETSNIHIPYTRNTLFTKRNIMDTLNEKAKRDPLTKQAVHRNTREDGRSRREFEYLRTSVKGLNKYYRLTQKIGEGTFSTVYKATDTRRDLYENKHWEDDLFLTASCLAEQQDRYISKQILSKSMSQFVAVKHIYSTSSPLRIAKEIQLLELLRGRPCISPLITAFREHKDIFLIMPYIQHDDFKTTVRTMNLPDIQRYMFCLLTALKSVHEKKIIHRDIKPNNFLYSNQKRTGYLIDFGLCEFEGKSSVKVSTQEGNKQEGNKQEGNKQEGNKQEGNRLTITNSNKDAALLLKPTDKSIKGYIKNDPRKPIVTNRAGTRGFRAPEVLLRADNQTTAIDIWSVGSIMLSYLMGKYPFFLSNDEADAMVEMTQLFGVTEMSSLATELDRRFETNIPGLPETRIDFMEECKRQNGSVISSWDPAQFTEAVKLAVNMLEPNPKNRLSAEEALRHPFFRTKDDKK
ncbi:kinase-like domain-containing protein [Pilobolus umbonatus]|nr:kinase-like domain-containing protein [Pilobolus umbonatus]